MISLNWGVSKSYLVDIVVETELLTILGCASVQEAATMVRCWATGQKYDAASRSHMYGGHRGKEGPLFPGVGVGPVHFIDEGCVFAHERGRRKRSRP